MSFSRNMGNQYGQMQQMMQRQMQDQQNMMYGMPPTSMPMQNLTRTQDVSGVQPVFQNMGNQNAMQQQMLQGLSGQAQAAGQRPQSGMNPMMLAQMLRGGQAGSYLSSIIPMMRYGAGNVYGGFGQGQVPTTTTGMD